MRRAQACARAHREAAPRPAHPPPADALHVRHGPEATPRWGQLAAGAWAICSLKGRDRNTRPAATAPTSVRRGGPAYSTIAALRAHKDHRLAGQTRPARAWNRTYATDGPSIRGCAAARGRRLSTIRLDLDSVAVHSAADYPTGAGRGQPLSDSRERSSAAPRGSMQFVTTPARPLVTNCMSGVHNMTTAPSSVARCHKRHRTLAIGVL